MLSWSSTEDGHPADLTALVEGVGDGGLRHGAELMAFADAIAGFDDEALTTARRRLTEVAGESFMVDAAAVAANFEMMTRVADGTGARLPAASATARQQLDQQLGLHGFTSRR